MTEPRLEKHYDAEEVEARWYAKWTEDLRFNGQPSAGGDPVTLSWDNSQFPPECNFVLKDNITGNLVNINMRVRSSFTDVQTME